MTKPTPESIIGWAGRTAASTVARTTVGGCRVACACDGPAPCPDLWLGDGPAPRGKHSPLGADFSPVKRPRRGDPPAVGGRPWVLSRPVQLGASIESTHMAKLKSLAQVWGCSVSAALRRIIDAW